MDCEKFEPLLLDELYEELDEVTSAAVKRHVSGCARCASILNGMRSTRRLAVLPMLELPDGLEDRILSSVKEAQKVVPIQSRASRALSLAGSWAMRPQTAMAAVVLLMIGTSAFVIRSRQGADRPGAVAVSVTEQGMPAGQSAPAEDRESLDNKAAAAAHGPNQPAPITAPPAVAVSPSSPVASAAIALNADPNGNTAGAIDGLSAGKGRPAKEEALGSALQAQRDLTDESPKDKNDDAQTQKRIVVTNEKKSAPPPAPVARRPADNITNAGPAAGAPDYDYAPRGQTIAPPPATKSAAADPQDGYSAGMAAYRARNFPEAQRQFDAAARSGDPSSALWAARTVKESTGCTAALPRFDAVAQKSSGSYVGNEAQLESARCQIQLGQLDAARDKLNKLAAVQTHAAAAQQALKELNQVASKREAERAKAQAGAGGGRPAAAAPARAAPRPATTAADSANKASGF